VASHASFTALVRDFYTRQSGFRNLVLGVFFTLFGAISLWRLADSAGLTMIFLIVLLVGLAAGLAPFYNALRAKAALQRGRIVRARVTSLRTGGPSRTTLDAFENGSAEGTRMVDLDGSQFEDQFSTDAPWAPDLAPGSMMHVVISDRRPEVLLEVGVGLTKDL
jgi:hypothetical protein